jgi:transcription initiation factor TFIIB
MLNQGPEWRSFTPEEKESRGRAGAPTDYSRYDKGLSTDIGINHDAFGRPLSPEVKNQMWRLRKWNTRYRNRNIERNLIKAMNELQRISEKVNVPSSVRETAAVIYRKALNENLIQGRSIAAIVAASLYTACRLNGTPKTLKEITKASLRDRKEITRYYRMLLERLKIKMPFEDPLYYVSKIAEKAGVSGATQGLAAKIIGEARKKFVTSGKDPMGISAAILHMACRLRKEKVTQKDIADAANISEVTLRNREKELVEKLDIAYSQKPQSKP